LYHAKPGCHPFGIFETCLRARRMSTFDSSLPRAATGAKRPLRYLKGLPTTFCWWDVPQISRRGRCNSRGSALSEDAGSSHEAGEKSAWVVAAAKLEQTTRAEHGLLYDGRHWLGELFLRLPCSAFRPKIFEKPGTKASTQG